MDQGFNNAETFVDQVKEYVNNRLTQLKLSFAEKTSKVMAVMVAVLLFALVFFLSCVDMYCWRYSYRPMVRKFLAWLRDSREE